MSERRTLRTAAIFCSLLHICTAPLFSNDLNSGGQRALLRTLTTETIGKTGFSLGVGYKHATEMEYVAGPNGSASVLNASTGSAVERSNSHLMSGNFFAVYGINSFWDVGITMPLYYDITGWDDETRNGLGDLEITTKLTYPFGRNEGWFTHGYHLKVLLPTGSTNRGFFPRHVYYLKESTIDDDESVFALSSVYFNPQMVWSADFSKIRKNLRLSIHANFGGVVATTKSNSALTAAFGAAYTVNDMVTFFTEISGESRVSWYTEVFKVSTFINDPFRVSPGMQLNFSNGLYLILAGDLGITKKSATYRTNFSREGYRYSTKATPRYGAQLTIGYGKKGMYADSDRDGIEDLKDLCPHEAEDPDDFKDSDGCPDYDNDDDGILDSRDSCPLQPAASSGCPILDHDKDGILDDNDNCRNEPEDIDGYKDSDGCPDLDNDGDGIFDTADKCPLKAEDMDGFEDTDGCPDIDNDADGVPDTTDKCPAIKGVPENNGCPKTKEIQRGRLILDGVNFESGKAILTPNSFRVLDRVYESLHEWTNVKLEIRGHTDNVGNDHYNKRLSQQRAESVMRYLITKGINSARLRAIGFGESSPIANNRTANGRAKNRRVELHRID